MNWLKENWFKVGIVLISLGLLGAAFYWYEWRPSQIKQECHQVAVEEAQKSLKTKVELGADMYREATGENLYLKDDYTSYYERCLNERGLR